MKDVNNMIQVDMRPSPNSNVEEVSLVKHNGRDAGVGGATKNFASAASQFTGDFCTRFITLEESITITLGFFLTHLDDASQNRV